MSTPRAQDVAEDAGFLSQLTRTVRGQPKRFRAGATLIEDLFNVKALRKKHARIARELMEAFPQGHPIWEMERDNVARMESELELDSDSMRLTMSDAESWARQQADSMDRITAEAVCLVVVCIYDDCPARNPALPKCMRTIPWGGWSDSGDVLPGRCFRFDGIGLNSELIERARIAWARVESWGDVNPAASASRSVQAHEGIRLAFGALAELLNARPSLKSATQPQQYAALRELHVAGRLKTYAGVKLPREGSFWAYIRQGHKIARETGPNLPE